MTQDEVDKAIAEFQALMEKPVDLEAEAPVDEALVVEIPVGGPIEVPAEPGVVCLQPAMKEFIIDMLNSFPACEEVAA